jgi:hypothetical protein
VLLADAPLTFREFAMQEPLPLATIFRSIFEFLTKGSDLVLFGAHAVNAYCEPERMTQDVDLLALDAEAAAEALRAHLFAAFHVAIRIREVSKHDAYRVYQVRDPKNRHLVDVRQVNALPPFRIQEGIQVVAPETLAAFKLLALHSRANKPKGGTDLVDLRRLLLAQPQLAADEGILTVSAIIAELGGSPAVLDRWRELATTPQEPDDDD